MWQPGSESNEGWSLLDPKNPSRGVSLTYTGGEQCTHTQNKNSGEVYNKPTRQIELNFPCRDIEIPQPIAANEKSYCHYEVTMPCQYGCPKVHSQINLCYCYCCLLTINTFCILTVNMFNSFLLWFLFLHTFAISGVCYSGPEAVCWPRHMRV